uniref:hypothetical protein n=1 Tax=Rhodococcus sp. TaxID=1831 RepID=UPI0025846B47
GNPIDSVEEIARVALAQILIIRVAVEDLQIRMLCIAVDRTHIIVRAEKNLTLTRGIQHWSSDIRRIASAMSIAIDIAGAVSLRERNRRTWHNQQQRHGQQSTKFHSISK